MNNKKNAAAAVTAPSEAALTKIDSSVFESMLASRGKRGRKATDWKALISAMEPGVPVMFQTGLKSKVNSHPNVSKLNQAARELNLKPGSAFVGDVNVVFGFQKDTGSLVGCLAPKAESAEVAAPAEA